MFPNPRVKPSKDVSTQVSALVFLFCSANPNATGRQVWDHVVATRSLAKEHSDPYVAGLVDYHTALAEW